VTDLPVAGEGVNVYDTINVDGPYVRHHFFAVRLSHGIVTEAQYRLWLPP